MYGLNGWFSLLFRLGVALALYPVSSAGAGQNILTNPGFEDAGLLAPFGAWQDNSGWAEVDVRYDRQVGRNGTGSAAHIVASHYRRGAAQFVQGGIAVRKGQTYVVSIWMRGNLSQPVGIVLREHGRPYRTLAGQSFRVSDEWREYRFKAVAKENSSDAYFMVRFEGDGELWLDDAELAEDRGTAQALSVVEGNLIANGGFEVGLGRWGVLYREAGSPVTASAIEYQNPQPVLDTAGAFEGRQAMRVEVPRGGSVTVSSAYVQAVPGHDYMLRVRLRADHRHKVRIGVGHGIFGDRRARPTSVVVGTQWKTYDLPVRLPQAVGDAYFAYVQSAEVGVLWIDAVELVQGRSGAYRPAAPVEVGLLREGLPTVMEVGDTSSLGLSVAAHVAGTATLKLTLYDYEGRRQELLTETLNLSAGDRWRSEVRIPTGQPGYFRALAEVNLDGVRVDADEFAVAVVPEAFAPRTDSPFGNHARFNGESLGLARQLGVSWLRLHPPRTTKWYSVEPEAGRFQFFDAAIMDAKRRGFQILGSLDGVPRWISTAPQDQTVHNNSGYTAYLPADYERWREYVYRTVEHYRGVIDYWEVWNEPSAHTFLKLPDGRGMGARADAYMKLLRIAYEAAKAANPDAKIVAGCSTTIPPADWFELLFERGAYDLMDIASVHLYQGDAPDGPAGISTAESVRQLRALMERQNSSRPPKPIWQTEVGIRHPGTMYETRVNAYVEAPLTGPEGAEYIVKRHVDVLASGIEKWFYYDMFWSERPDRQDYIGLFEWDGAARPAAAAYAVLAHMLHGLKFEAMVGGGNDQVVIAKFSGGGRIVYVAWSSGEGGRAVIPLADDGRIAAVYDIMGRAVAQSSATNASHIDVGVSPQYIVIEKMNGN